MQLSLLCQIIAEAILYRLLLLNSILQWQFVEIQHKKLRLTMLATYIAKLIYIYVPKLQLLKLQEEIS